MFDFWLILFFCNLSIPLIMIILGSLYSKRAPKEINNWHGYRSPMSKINRATWEFAHNFFGKLWKTIGWILMPVCIAVMFFSFGKTKEIVESYALNLLWVQTVILIISIIPTEIALRKKFDKNGEEKSK